MRLWLSKQITRLYLWWARHVVQRIYAPSLLDAKHELFKHWQKQSDRWMELASNRRRDNQKLMHEVVGRIEAFRGASHRLTDVHIEHSPRRSLRFVLPPDVSLMKLERGDSRFDFIRLETMVVDIEEFTARVNLGLYRSEDFSIDDVRWATAIILIDQLSVFIARQNAQRGKERSACAAPCSVLP